MPELTPETVAAALEAWKAKQPTPPDVDQLRKDLVPSLPADLVGPEVMVILKRDTWTIRREGLGYLLTGSLAIHADLGLVVNRVEVMAKDGVTSTLVASAMKDLVPWIQYDINRQKGRAKVREAMGWPEPNVDPETVPDPTPRGNRGRSDETYRLVAELYLELIDQGIAHGILNVLAEELGLTREQVRDRVRGATERGYLNAGTPGKAGRRRGPNLDPTTTKPTSKHVKEELQ